MQVYFHLVNLNLDRLAYLASGIRAEMEPLAKQAPALCSVWGAICLWECVVCVNTWI